MYVLLCMYCSTELLCVCYAVLWYYVMSYVYSGMFWFGFVPCTCTYLVSVLYNNILCIVHCTVYCIECYELERTLLDCSYLYLRLERVKSGRNPQT